MHQNARLARRYIMGKNVETLLAVISRYDPSPSLYRNIIALIGEEQRATARSRFWSFAGASFVSFAFFIPALQNAFSSLAQSGFIHYSALIFSDTDVVLLSWKEFSLLLFESLPLVAILACLLTVFAFLWSLSHATRAMPRALILTQRLS